MIRIPAGKSFQPETKDKKKSFGMCTLTVSIRVKFFGYKSVAPLFCFTFKRNRCIFFPRTTTTTTKIHITLLPLLPRRRFITQRQKRTMARLEKILSTCASSITDLHKQSRAQVAVCEKMQK